MQRLCIQSSKRIRFHFLSEVFTASYGTLEDYIERLMWHKKSPLDQPLRVYRSKVPFSIFTEYIICPEVVIHYFFISLYK